MRNKIIAFMGAHGVGKSSLMLSLGNRLKKEHPDWEINIVPEGARTWPLKNFLKIKQLGIFAQQLMNECQSVIISDQVLTCRSVLDNLAYALFSEQENKTILPWVHKATALAKELCKDYRLLIYLRPIGHKIMDDGFRLTTIRSQTEIDKIIYDLTLDLPGVNLLVPDLNLGFEIVLDLIMDRLR